MRKISVYHKQTEETGIKGPMWLTTFNDMSTLLLVFFVLLFTMGSLDVQRYKHFRNALQSAMGVLNEGRRAPVGLIDEKVDERNSDSAAEPSSVKLGDTGEKSRTERKAMNGLALPHGLEAQYTPRGIQLTLHDNVLFQSGDAWLTEKGAAMLKRVAAIIKPLNRNIRVEGHSDNVPIRTPRFPSNWELSTDRAVNVVKFFIERGGIDPHRLSAAGCADTKPRVANDNDRDRARNRRVEIVLERAPSPPEPPQRNGMRDLPAGSNGGN